MVHSAAADLAMDIFEEHLTNDPGEEQDPLEVARCIAFLAYVTRNQLFGNDWLLGEQHVSEEELETQRKLQMVTSSIFHGQHCLIREERD
jgi:hypothetical protein